MPLQGDTTILWYQIDNMSDEMKDAIDQIQHTLKLCVSENDLWHSIDLLATNDNKILFIISGNLPNINSLLSLIHSNKYVVRIFIYNYAEASHMTSLKNYSKLDEIFDDYKYLIKIVSKMARILIRQQSVLELKYDEEQSYMRDLIQENEVKEVRSNLERRAHFLPEFTKRNELKEEFLFLCRSFYSTNSSYLKKIDEFEQTYNSKDALKWYTKDSFFYKVINHQLRTRSISDSFDDIDYFLIDICSQLKQEWKKNLTQNQANLLRVYRGSMLSPKDLDWIKNHKGSTISIPGFFSTSKSKNTAECFYVNVLFEIELNTKLQNVIYADLSGISEMQDEDEVLFNFNSIFKINQVYSNEMDGQLHIELIALDGNNVLDQSCQDMLIDENISFQEKISFCENLCDVDDVKKAIEYLKNLFNLIEDTEEKSFVFYNLGIVYLLDKDFQNALYYFQSAYNISKTFISSDTKLKSNYGERMIDLGLVYVSLKEYDLALDMFIQSINSIHYNDIEEAWKTHYYNIKERLKQLLYETFILNKPDQRAVIHLSLAIINWYIQMYESALIHLEYAKNLIAPNDDYRFLIIYHCFSAFTIADIERPEMNLLISKQQFLRPEKHFGKMVELAYLSKNFHLISPILENVAEYYQTTNQMDLSIKYYIKAVLSSNVENKTTILRIIEKIHEIYQEAEECHNTIQFFHRILSKFNDNLAKINKYLADVYTKNDELINACFFYETSFKLYLQEKDFHNADDVFQCLFDRLMETKQFDRAIQCYYTKLNLKKINISEVESNEYFAKAYRKINDLDTALIYYEKSFEIYLEEKNFNNAYQIIESIHDIHLKKNQFDHAIEYYHMKNINNEEKKYTAKINQCLTIMFLEKNDIVNALSYYRKSIELYLLTDIIFFKLDIIERFHKIFIETKQFQQAIECYQMILSKMINNNKEYIGKFNRYLGDIYYKINDIDKALNCYENELQIYLSEICSNRDYSIIELLHQIYMETKNFDRAIVYYREILFKFDDTCAGIKYKTKFNKYMGDIYARNNNSINARIYYLKSIDHFLINKDVNDIRIAIEYLKRESGEDTKRFKSDTSEAKLNHSLGKGYRILKDFHMSLVYYKKSLEIHFYQKDFDQVHELITEIHNLYLIQKQFDQAIEYYQMILLYFDINNDNKEYITKLHLYLAIMYLNKNEPINALTYYEKSIDLHQYNDTVLFQIEIIEKFLCIYIEKNQFDKANEYCQKILEKYNDNFDGSSYVAEMNQCLGDMYARNIVYVNNTLEYYKKSLEIEFTCEVFKKLHRIYQQTKRFDEAFQYYLVLFELYKDDDRYFNEIIKCLEDILNGV